MLSDRLLLSLVFNAAGGHTDIYIYIYTLIEEQAGASTEIMSVCTASRTYMASKGRYAIPAYSRYTYIAATLLLSQPIA